LNYDIIFYYSKIRESPEPLKFINELDVNENIRALLRRLYLQEKTGLSLSATGSTILDFAESEEYRGLNVIGALQAPIWIAGFLNILVNNADRELPVIFPFINGDTAKRLIDAVAALSKAEISISLLREGDNCIVDLSIASRDKSVVEAMAQVPQLSNLDGFIIEKTSFLTLVYYMLGLDPSPPSIPLTLRASSAKEGSVGYNVSFREPKVLMSNLVVEEIRGLARYACDAWRCVIPVVYSMVFDLGHALIIDKP